MIGYALAIAAVIPTAGSAAERFGPKRLFIGSVLVFAFGSTLRAAAPSILLRVAFRIAQGAGGSVLIPLAVSIITREAGTSRLGRSLSVVGVPMLPGQSSVPF